MNSKVKMRGALVHTAAYSLAVFCCLCICMVICVSDVYDVMPPTIELLDLKEQITVCVEEGISYREYLHITDNSSAKGQIKVSINSAGVNIDKPGVYTAKVVASDRHGNTSTKEIKICIVSLQITQDMLSDLIALISEQIITDDMNAEQKCRRIYEYVTKNIMYSESEQDYQWMEAAYYGLTNFKGDCFACCAVAGAFFEYLGIEFFTVKRLEGKTEDTHFWSIVNIGDTDDPRWYHFDCTRLYPTTSMMGCLMTNAQLERYCRFRENITHNPKDKFFYWYDENAFPDISGKEITDINV